MQSTHLPRKAFLRGLMAWAGGLAIGRVFMRRSESTIHAAVAASAASLSPKAQTRAVPYKHLSA